jgi:hypothetical protein
MAKVEGSSPFIRFRLERRASVRDRKSSGTRRVTNARSRAWPRGGTPPRRRARQRSQSSRPSRRCHPAWSSSPASQCVEDLQSGPSQWWTRSPAIAFRCRSASGHELTWEHADAESEPQAGRDLLGVEWPAPATVRHLRPDDRRAARSAGGAHATPSVSAARCTDRNAAWAPVFASGCVKRRAVRTRASSSSCSAVSAVTSSCSWSTPRRKERASAAL